MIGEKPSSEKPTKQGSSTQSGRRQKSFKVLRNKQIEIEVNEFICFINLYGDNCCLCLVQMVPWPAEVWSGTAGYFFTVVALIIATWIAQVMKLVKQDNARFKQITVSPL
jgi:hypothetical protein